MNPSSKNLRLSTYHKLFILVVFGVFLLVPFTAMAQESTEEPQPETVVTEEATVEQEPEVVETVAPTEEPVAEETPLPTDEPVSETQEATPIEEVEPVEESLTPEPETPVVEETEAAAEETSVTVEPIEDVVAESTEDPSVEIIETEVAPEETAIADETPTPEVVVIEEPPAEITQINEDFEAWTGENWTIIDWSVEQVSEGNSLSSTVADASAELVTLPWTDYAITVDVQVLSESLLTLRFEGYDLSISSDGTSQLRQGEELIAAPPSAIAEEGEPTWHTVSINKSDSIVTILIDDIPQFGFEATNAPLGIFAFITGSDQGVRIDNLAMTKIEPNVIEEIVTTPTPEENNVVDSPEATEEVDLLAEVTEEPDLLAEATEEPDMLVAEATEEPVASVEDVVEESPEINYVVSNLITEDFEGDLEAWTTSANIVEIADGNHVLLMGVAGQLSPATQLEADNLTISGEASIVSNSDVAGQFSVLIGDTLSVDISSIGVTLSQNGEVVASVEAAQTLNSWFTFAIDVSSDGVTVSINQSELINHTSEIVVTGDFAITTNTSVMFDNISVDTLVEEEVIEPVATPVPEATNDDILGKMGGHAHDLMQTFFDSGDEGVAIYLADTSASQDEAGRILVDILASKTSDGATVAQIVADAGGVIERTYNNSIEAYVNVSTLLAISNNENIRFVRNVSRAVSTGPVGTKEDGGTIESWTEAFNGVSAEAWHAQSVLGQDVKIGVVDTGFEGADTGRDGNLSCLASTSLQSGPGGSTALFNNGDSADVRGHGTEMIELICDIAPSADVYMFRADEENSLTDAIIQARSSGNRMDILVIALDLGADTSAGGGVSGDTSANVYGQLEAAKNEGIVPIVAAGNNNQRVAVLEITDDMASFATITIENMAEDDVVKFGWNDFDDDGNSLANITVNLDSQGNVSSDDPVVNPLSVILEDGPTGTKTLNVRGTSVSASEDLYLQIQVVPNDPTSEVKITSVATVANSTDITADNGNLGRPADSDDVISVGAVCFRDVDNSLRWEFSSNGPRFKPDGSPLDAGWDTVITQEEAKPSVMSFSFVTTSTNDGPVTEGISESAGLLNCADGFGGTSAAAAHVAGMTALLMSNDANTSFADLNEANATSDSTFEAIRDYLQSHAVDMPFGADADGFDVDYGAGLSILGAPTYDLNDTVNVPTAADLLPDACLTGNGGETLYVGQADMGNTTLDGTVASPFISIGQALNAVTPATSTCIVVMPGEYVTPIVIDQTYTADVLVTGYDDVSRGDYGDAILWLRNQYVEDRDPYEYGQLGEGFRRNAGVYFTDQAENVELSGFTFVVAPLYTSSDYLATTTTIDVQAVVMDGSTNTTISNSQFGTVSLEGVEYTGWVNLEGTPVLVINGAQGARIDNNIFNDNIVNTLGTGFYPTVAVIGSGSDDAKTDDPTDDEPIVIIDNTIYGNVVDHTDNDEWGAILYSSGSAIDIINNAIYDNTGETIIKIATDNPVRDGNPTDKSYKRQARIVGNVLLENDTSSSIGQAGSIINLRYTPMIYIINNTMISNTVGSTDGDFGQLISRGNKDSGTGEFSDGGSNAAGFDFWEIHNNLIYNNTFRVLVGDTSEDLANIRCNRIPNDVNPPVPVGANDLNAFLYTDYSQTLDEGDDVNGEFVNRGAQNNWIDQNSSVNMGTCTAAINQASNDNMKFGDNQPVDSRSTDDSTFPYLCPLPDNTDQGTLVGDFRGYECDSPYRNNVSAWQFYALAQTYVSPDGNSLFNEYSDLIDAAQNKWLEDGGGDAGDPYIQNADVDEDLTGTSRPLNVNDWVIDHSLTPPRGITSTDDVDYALDIGAFEFSPLQFATNAVDGDTRYYDTDLPITVGAPPDLDPVTDNLLEDTGIVTFDISTVVTGGFGEVSYAIAQDPNNYGTQCGPEFENTKGLVQRGNGFEEIFDYCLPEDFYTYAESGFEYVSFKIQISDEAGASTLGELRFTVDAVQDSDFDDDTSVAIGDGSPDAGDTFEVVTTLGANITVRLRPYVRAENFFFSESSNSEFLVGGNKIVDYPFQYDIISISDPDDILVGESAAGGFTTDPTVAFTMSESETGEATITYTVRDANTTDAENNILIIRSVSIIPTEGLLDDTNLVWNYSDGDSPFFYTERAGFEGADVPTSGSWQALRQIGAINDTVHTTTGQDDIATFRFVGTGFTLYMKNGTENGTSFAINIYDDDDEKLDGSMWQSVGGGSVINERQVGDLVCTTRAAIDTNDVSGQQLQHSEDDYTITCNGLGVRKHTVQVVNKGTGALSVDAFAIITDTSGFTDAGPLPPGFYDIDNAMLGAAFGGWTETPNSEFSNGVAFVAPSAFAAVSFTVTDASGFAIGSAYGNTSATFDICVDNDKIDNGEGVCTTIADDAAGATANGIHHPFFGLNPDTDYTITLKSIDAGFIFDGLVVFDENMIPTSVLGLGQADINNINLVIGEPFGDDWIPDGNDLAIAEGRSPIGPFVAFEVDDTIDGIRVTMTNEIIDTCIPTKKVACPAPPPSGLGGLQICVNRGIQASENNGTPENCIVVDAILNTTTGLIEGNFVSPADAGPVEVVDSTLIIDETLFDDPWDDWASSENNTIELFSLTNDENLKFTNVEIFSSSAGIGAGTYPGYASGITFLDYNPADNTYEVEPTPLASVGANDVAASWVNRDIEQCFKEKKGVCQDLRVVGNAIQTAGIGDAILFNMQGTGFAPTFGATDGSYARACWLSDSNVASPNVEDIAGEVHDEALADGGCRTLDNTGAGSATHHIYGLPLDSYWVLVELLPSPDNMSVVMNLEAVQVFDENWETLTALDTSQRFETSYINRFTDNRFSYTNEWSTVTDTSGSHSSTSYDLSSGNQGASVVFKVTGANSVKVIRDLASDQAYCNSQKDFDKGKCTAPEGNVNNLVFCSKGNQKKGNCPTLGSGYSDILVCVAPVAAPNRQDCAVYQSTGDATQDVLPISLPDASDYVISITALADRPFVIDAIELADSTADKMVEGIYQEDSALVTYGNGNSNILKDTSFENLTTLLDTSTGIWNWNFADSLTIDGSISTEQSFVGTKSAKIDVTAASESLDSETFQIVNSEWYTAVARVYVDTDSTSVAMDLLAGTTSVSADTTKYSDKWELLVLNFQADATETAQLSFIAQDASMTFFVDDVHVYRGNGAWVVGDGGLTDGRIATSDGYGATAKFLFNGTGFTVKLASDTSSGETTVCYDTNANMSTANCFTYDNEQEDEPDVCTGKGSKAVCTIGIDSANNGHTVVGLTDTDYYVTVTQADNGLRTAAVPEVCSGSGKNEVCVPSRPANSPNDGPTTVKIDYIEIYDQALPPVLSAGEYNEDDLIGLVQGLNLYPSSDWTQQVDATGSYTENSFYQVSNDQIAGAVIELQLENDEPTTIVIDINQANTEADQVLACIGDVNGAVEFNGTSYDLTSSDCTLTDLASQQSQLVFDETNLPSLNASGTDRLFTLRSLTKDAIMIDGYQIIHGTTLTGGFYENTLGFGVAGSDSIYTITNVSGTDDWTTISSSSLESDYSGKFSGGSALATAISGTTLSFTFEGTGVSIVPGTGEPVETCTKEKSGVCTNYEVTIPPVGQIDISLDTMENTPDICTGGASTTCDDELGAMTNIDVTNGPISISGLPDAIYTVTITTKLDAGEVVSFDAVEVYGDLQELGSLYDDAQVDINNDLLLTYGPKPSNWQGFTGASEQFLYKTFHQADSGGSTVSFTVGAGTDGIVIYDGDPSSVTSDVEVCWSEVNGGALSRTCTTVDLDNDESESQVDITPAGTYNVSITNKSNSDPLVIDAIQILEDGIMAEGIYENDSTELVGGTDESNTDSSNGSVRQINTNGFLRFKFEGIAFSAQIVESSEEGSETSLNYDICVYANHSDETNCTNSPDIVENITTRSNNTLSVHTYAGFTDTSGPENANGQWTVVIRNNHANTLLIDRIDILGVNNDLTISDTEIYEAGDPHLRYLPFGSWVENTSFKYGVPLNDAQYETTLPGAVTYFEVDTDEYIVEYLRQIQDAQVIEECVKFSKGKCSKTEVINLTPFADGNICIGEIGDPDLGNMSCTVADNDAGHAFQYGSSTPEIDCTANGCWGYVDYGRNASGNTKTTIDYIRLYDPEVALTTGAYQENHPALDYFPTNGVSVATDSAEVGFYHELDTNSSDGYVAFPFEGTGFSVRTLISGTAEDIELCVYGYTGAIPELGVDYTLNDLDCVRSYDQDIELDSGISVADGITPFVTRSLHGLSHESDYIGFVRMLDDSNAATTVLGIDQVEIFNEQWFDETDLSDGTYTNQLMGGSSYDIDYATRDTDKLVQFTGSQWMTVSEQVQTGCADKKCKQPIFTTFTTDRGIGSGASALFRTDGASVATVDLKVNGTGDVQFCSTPLTLAGPDLSTGAICQTITVTEDATVSFTITDSSPSEEHVVTVELLTPILTTSEEVCLKEKNGVCSKSETVTTTSDPWMDINKITLFDVVTGLTEGQYNQNFAGISYDSTYMALINEDMEAGIANWDAIGSLQAISQSAPEVCTGSGKSEVCTVEPTFTGDVSLRIAGIVGQGVEYANTFDLDDATYYTAVANILIDEASLGDVTMQILDGVTELTETNGMNLTVTSLGKWQTIRATFETEAAYTDLTLQFLIGSGEAEFFVDDVTLTKGGEWAAISGPLGPDVCTGKGSKQVCVPGDPIFDAINGDLYQSTTPGASFTFDFIGTGFELGLLGGNRTGEVQVCYHPESDANDVNCFTYSQDDGVPVFEEICTKTKKGVCTATRTDFTDSTSLFGRGIAGLEQDTWTVTVREVDNGYYHGDNSQSRVSSTIACVPDKKGCTDTEVATFAPAIFAVDYVNIFDDTDIIAVPAGTYNEDATDGSDDEYLKVYPEDSWEFQPGTNIFSNNTYLTPANEWPGPIALLQLDVDASDDIWTIVFQFGQQSSFVVDSALVCVDETNGVMSWENDQYTLTDSTNCMILNDIAEDNQASITSADIPALATTGQHNVTISSLSPVGLDYLQEVCVKEKKGVCSKTELQTAQSNAFLRIDGYHIFEGGILTAGIHNEVLPDSLMSFSGDGIDKSDTCDSTQSWCRSTTVTKMEPVCTKFKNDVCTKEEIQSIVKSPYIGGAAYTAQEGATLDFTIQGSGFSIISDVYDQGLDFRVCYKLNSSNTSFPTRGSADEDVALAGIDGSDQPIRVSEGGVLCEEMTTDTDNWNSIMDRPLSSGEQYGFSFYGMPFATYDVQLMVTSTQDQIDTDDRFVVDAIQVFTSLSTVSALPEGLTDNRGEDIIYEPLPFWDSNDTTDTYLNTESVTNHAGAIAQFAVDGNSLVLYQRFGDMTSDVQLCLIISNENIHCSVESERQTRIAQQVTSFTQFGILVDATICTKFKNGVCTRSEDVQVRENSPFTPVVFYGLGGQDEHKVILENRVHGETFNIDAIQVIP